MFNPRQTILASRPAAMVLALSLVAGLSAPFLLLPRAHAAPTPPTPLACTVANNNGCTELSATPPEDTTGVPPNIVLMLDDSGSMAWDYMPDWEYLPDTSRVARNGVWDYDGVRNSALNALYYNPTKTYTPPPKADGTLYLDSPSLTHAFKNGFLDPTHFQNITTYVGGGNGDSFAYYDSLQTTDWVDTSSQYPAAWGGGTPYRPGSPYNPGSPGGDCPSNYHHDPDNAGQCIRDPVSPTPRWKCNAGDGSPYPDGDTQMCHHYMWVEGHHNDYPYPAIPNGVSCPGGSSLQADNLCHYPDRPVTPPTPPTGPTDPVAATPNYKWVCSRGGTLTPADAPAPPSDPPPAGYDGPECAVPGGHWRYVYVFTYVTGTTGNYVQHYVAPGNDCDILADAGQKSRCTNESNTLGVAAPDGVSAGQNVANWFSYYRTRMLMAKSGLMTAFTDLKPNFRFGFASINGNGEGNIIGPEYVAGTPYSPGSSMPYVTFDDSFSGGGDSTNRLAVVQPFGTAMIPDPSDPTGVAQVQNLDSQRYKFWNWLANESPNNGTPLRKALQAAGEYYKTDQPWQTMPGDPGYTKDSTTKFACRASYTILTTDGFWNGTSPTTPAGIVGAAGTNGPVQTVPAGDTTTQYLAQAPFNGGAADAGASLADVATYYWENDLQPDIANELSFGNKADPAAWQHMTTFTIGLGFVPRNIAPSTVCDAVTDANCRSIFAWAAGAADAAIAGWGDASWPEPSASNDGSVNNIADLVHAAVNGHGVFENVTDPTQLAQALALIFTHITGRDMGAKPAALNASVLSLGAMSFSIGYNTADWTGTFKAVALNADGTVDDADASLKWDAGYELDSAYHSPAGYSGRTVYTDSYKADGTFNGGAAFTAGNLDGVEKAGLSTPPFVSADDTLDNRINYLLGQSTYEGSLYRVRQTILGAILHSQPVYVSYPSSGYYNDWPSGSQEAIAAAASNGHDDKSYDSFIVDHSSRAPTVYLAANDGMLHAFNAPLPTCAADGTCTRGTDPGKEDWAFVPRAVYANLGNLTVLNDFHFRPTVDATPVTRDVFFSQGGPNDGKWRTILAGGVGLGGRGVYALDITDPTAFSTSSVLWEFDADYNDGKPISGCVASYGDCLASDLGFTVSQPNIGRLAVKNGTVTGEWVVLVPNGYFPDCTTPDMPTADQASCEAIAKQAPKDSSGKPYSALFVIDAQTGKVIAELKTPQVAGVTSFGLATPVMGDYDSDQVDDVAFAGDVEGNLWRFDLSSANPSDWTVTLAYKGITDGKGNQGVQPITTMPRLMPDPTTNLFMVVFGTGRYLGVGDNTVGKDADGNPVVQAVYGIRDQGDSATNAMAYQQSDLVQQTLSESVVTAPGPNEGATLRSITNNPVPAGKGGWYFNLYTTTSGTQNDSGERVVATPGAVFASNTVIIPTLITGGANSDLCNPLTQGAIMAINAVNGGPGVGVSALGGSPVVGGRISNARTSGSLPIVSALGGGAIYIPGVTLSNAAKASTFSLPSPVWRRRSWHPIKQNP